MSKTYSACPTWFCEKKKQSELGKLRWVLSVQRRKLKENEKRIKQLVEGADFSRAIDMTVKRKK